MIKIRLAGEKDYSTIVDFVRKLAVFNNEENEIELTLENLEKDAAEGARFWCLLAEDGNETIGFAFFFECYSTWKGKYMHIDDLYVDENYRKQGIGKMFFVELAKIAKKRGYKRIDWHTHVNNINAQEFYKHIGAFKQDRSIYYRLDETGIDSLS